jgi:Spy/CpxP family protein refolding chaperone
VKTWRIFLAICLIFSAGAGTGALVARRVAAVSIPKERHTPPSPPNTSPDKKKDYLERLDAKLNLTPEQRAKIDKLLQESQARMKQLWADFEPQTREEYRRTRKEISDLLDPAQKEIYQNMRKDREKKGDGKGEKDGHGDKDKKQGSDGRSVRLECPDKKRC